MNIVLHEPGIALNTGNIGRTCVAAGAALHLIKPYAFRINEKEIRRSGMDYWRDVNLTEYLDYESFMDAHPELSAYNGSGFSGTDLQAKVCRNAGNSREARPRLWYATTKALYSYADVTYGPDDYIMFGNESRGIPEEILVKHPAACIRIPMAEGARSLNLANSAAIILYEALRQNGFPGMLSSGGLHRLKWEEQ